MVLAEWRFSVGHSGWIICQSDGSEQSQVDPKLDLVPYSLLTGAADYGRVCVGMVLGMLDYMGATAAWAAGALVA